MLVLLFHLKVNGTREKAYFAYNMADKWVVVESIASLNHGEAAKIKC
jgi:hypothetical protein